MLQKNDTEVNARIKWAFFGTSLFSVIVLDELKAKGFLPTLIVTVEDKPKGRKLIMTPPEVKVWAEKESIKYIQLKTLRKPEAPDEIKSYAPDGFDLFIVASYGKIIPPNILDIPKHKTINVHPSLLPKLRGPSPIQSAILEESETGVSIIELDEEVDHGPILAQKKILSWGGIGSLENSESDPPYAEDLEKKLGTLSGRLLGDLLPDLISGKIKAVPQEHSLATFCKKIEKADGEINWDENPEKNLRKIRAYHIWPGAYFFDNRDEIKKRIIIKRAHVDNGNLILDRVVPEGKKEMPYSDFLRTREQSPDTNHSKK